MADWKQITARIRRARGSKDPAGQLTVLYEKTKDAMVAFELGRHFEIVGDPAKALEWYQSAHSRFRRGDWKDKSSEAIVRLGGELPVRPTAKAEPDAAQRPSETAEVRLAPVPEPANTFEQNGAVDAVNSSSNLSPPDAASAEKKHRRRGRRGGRNRNKKASPGQKPVSESRARSHEEQRRERAPVEAIEIAPPRSVDSRSIPRVPVSQLPEAASSGVRGRFGDPGLSSRLSLLEMHLRRLLTCPPAKLDQADSAPAGPGVFVLTDDDMTTYFHVEACDTLRIAIGTLAKTGSTRRGNPSLKPLLAENLGIPEARVAKYLSDHCVVRWLQLDEGAPQFAHFAIAVLRPILDE
jgi:hypothetical protein